MAKSKRRREKETGYLKKIDGKYYLRTRIDGHDRYTMLHENDGTPITGKDRAAEVASITAEKTTAVVTTAVPTLNNIWEYYLKAEERPQSGDSTLRNYHTNVSTFCEWYGKDVPITEITPLDAKNFFKYLWDQRGISSRTYNGYRQALSLVFKVLCGQYALAVNPFANIQSKPQRGCRHNAFTAEQVTAIFQGFKTGFFYTTEVEVMGKGRQHIRKISRRQYKPMYADEVEVMLLLCCWTGCRGQDACLMRWRNINFDKNEITYTPIKTAGATDYNEVSLPLHPDLRAGLLKAQSFKDRNKDGEDYIIPQVHDRYEYNDSGLQTTVKRIIECATGESTTASTLQGHRKLRANIYGTHSFRHTFISFCANAGIPLEVVAAIVGHASVEMTRHYTHISDEAKQNAIDKLATADVKKASNLLKKLEALPEEKINALIALIG